MAASYVPVGAHRSAVLGHVLSLLLLLLLAAAQSTWPTWLRLSGQAPELVLAAVISLGLACGGATGLTAGFIGAFLWASLADMPMGNLFISYMGLGFVAGTMRGRMFSDRVSLAAILVAASVIVAALIKLILAPPPSPESWLAVVFARAVFSALATIPIYPLVRLLSQYYPLPEEP
jgi:cell shape-determining protein MreD